MALLDDLTIEDILDWAGIHYRLSQGGSGEQANIKECPECGNSNWKTYIGTESGLGNCFACDKRYNLWSFVGSVQGTANNSEIAKALMKIRQDLKLDSGLKKFRENKRLVSHIESNSTLPDSIRLPIDGRNLAYLDERGISGRYADLFDLRICMRGFHRYTEYGQSKSTDFSKRVIIPIRDLDGEVVTFQGRDITGTSETKYLFPKGLPASGKFLYNGYSAYLTRAREVILNEGVMDVIATKIVCDAYPDMKDVVPVGSFGKHLSDFKTEGESQVGQFARLKRDASLKRVIIMWDGEPKALDAALTAAETLMKIGLEVFVAMLPAGKDPNEVPPSEVYMAYKAAIKITRLEIIKLRLNNPYK